jgi:DNA topoisomerase I
LSKNLVIVESPTKAKTINKYLGKDYFVEASLGHIKDLPKSKLGVDIEGDFDAEYNIIPGKEKVVAKLKKLAERAPAIYLAPDPDREGEAIAAHLAQELGDGKKKKKKGGTPIHRVTFNEITKKAVQDAFQHPREIDQDLVDAQQTRRVLDRLVGYQVSPLLWDKVRRGLSAGRVQTVALRLIVERDREIKAFQRREYWTIDANLVAAKSSAFDARFVGRGEEKTEIPNEEESKKILAALETAQWSVRNIEKKERRRSPAPPFTTSRFQQDASRKLRFSVKRAMMIAQRLYEGVELGEEGSVGLITYMRTDSVRVSNDAVAEVREMIASSFGKEFLPETPNAYKSKKEAQEAHEAIRPSSVARHPDEVKKYLQEDEYKVYKLIWQRFVASQMNPAVFDQTSVDVEAKTPAESFTFRVTGSVPKFEGFLKVYEESKEGKDRDEEEEELKRKLPPLETGQRLTLKELKPEQHFTEPPPRYNEASLVKELEERGIGRPSTYATILSTIQERQYVQKLGGKFIPTEIGLVVTDLLVENFPDIFDFQYTARLEEELDEIEEGKEKWTVALGDFYKKFEKDLRYAQKHMENIKRMEKPTEEKCERCGSPLVLKWGKHGSFFACSAYKKDDPESCTFTKENPINLPDLDTAEMPETTQEEYCENCGRVMVLKRGRFGQFMACTGYPDCKTTRRLDQGRKVPDVALEDICPKCGRNLVLRHGRYGEFISCSGYPECKYIKQNYIGVHCPLCQDGELVEKKARRRGNLFYGCSNYPKCKFTSAYKPVAEKCPQCGSPYLLEKYLKSGPVLSCPNNTRKSAEAEEVAPKKKTTKGKKAKAETEEAAPTQVKCDYSRPLPQPAAVS